MTDVRIAQNEQEDTTEISVNGDFLCGWTFQGWNDHTMGVVRRMLVEAYEAGQRDQKAETAKQLKSILGL